MTAVQRLGEISKQLYEQIETMNKELGTFKSELDRSQGGNIKNFEKVVKALDYNIQFQDNIIQNYFPDKKRDLIEYRVRERQKNIDLLRTTLSKYQEIEKNIETLETYMQVVKNMDAIQKVVKKVPRYEDLEKTDYQLRKKAADYANKLRLVTRNATGFLLNFNKELEHYVVKYEKKEGAAGKAIALALTAIFSVTVLYSLSQINPENVTTGAFFAGEGSPLILAMLSGVVVFVLFFLTHHKLK